MSDYKVREKLLNVLVKHELNIDMTSKDDMDFVLARAEVYQRLSLMTSRKSTIELIDMLEPIVTESERAAKERLLDELEAACRTMLNYPSGYMNSGVSIDVIRGKRQELKDQGSN
ncbi:hypothetical protein QFZ70_001487 [Arthrobacter sp. V1I9]|uniref:hypothetical protein n=1 Tax=Arthrobacter sp. V1I9 TaxID=3042275 RepID=UPI002793DB68|nr:hypothetical protein [Arthrobacter sp. V1I9]MDQ0869014.1 hypothetical protein [Arthrobacter sp. V1I9]